MDRDEEARQEILQEVAMTMWREDSDNFDKFMDQLHTDDVFYLWQRAEQGTYRDELAAFIEDNVMYRDKHEDGRSGAVTNRPDGLQYGEVDGAGPSTNRKIRINATNTIFGYLTAMKLNELYEQLHKIRPTKGDKDDVWQKWFDNFADLVSKKMHELPEDDMVVKVNAKVAELQLAQGGVAAQVGCHSNLISSLKST